MPSRPRVGPSGSRIFIRPGVEPPRMSDPTKILLATLVASLVVGVLLLAGITLG